MTKKEAMKLQKWKIFFALAATFKQTWTASKDFYFNVGSIFSISQFRSNFVLF